MKITRDASARKQTRAELFRGRADAVEQVAAFDRALADLEEQEAAREPSGWISQATSPIGKRRHLDLFRRLRDQKSEGLKAAGKARLIRADIFEASLEDAQTKPKKPATTARDRFADAFGVRRSA